MKFIDEARVRAAGGDGGPGKISWRREKFVPLGGPDGGDGGSGGAVIFVTDPGLNTLIDFAFSPQLNAESGAPGDANQRHGRDGADCVCRVPVGTQVYRGEELVADLSSPNSCWIAARGGRGGKGNAYFKAPTNQAPDFAQPGRAGEIHELRLVLKSVADAGLVGLPNTGKSTLVAAVSKAHPKIADYPFTTLRPSLGVVVAGELGKFVLADIPGLIPGAHTGKGLGLRFLQHVERTAVLAQLIDIYSSAGESFLGSEPDDQHLIDAAITQYQAIDDELRLFSPELSAKPRLIVFSKADLPHTKRAYELCLEFFQGKNLPVMLISSHTGLGLDEFKHSLCRIVHNQRNR